MARPIHRSRGAGILLALAALGIGAAAVYASGLAGNSVRLARERATDRSLAAAREALIAYATGRAIDAVVGPGYLPCPDLDGDGWAESTCGSQSGDSGQARRLGRLPWKTLGLAELRDGHGERLWYAVSSKYKGLLNCTVSASCLDMSPDAALGTITVRDATGALVHDGRIADLYRANAAGAAAVVIAPGPALDRFEGAPGPARRPQVRACAPGDCDSRGTCLATPPARAATCDPRNYLERAPGAQFGDEDNADFVDRNDAPGRAGNANGFILGPVRLRDGTMAVNDRLAIVSYDDVMPRLMKRVAIEAARCLARWADLPGNGGRLPWPTPPCRQAGVDRALAWEPAEGALFGRIPAPVASTCGLTLAPAPNWWEAWRGHVFYALAPAHRGTPGVPECKSAEDCLRTIAASGQVLGTGKLAAVIVAGAPLPAAGQSHAAGSEGDPRQWLEGAHGDLERMNAAPAAPECPAAPAAPCAPGAACNRVVLAARSRVFNDVAVTIP